MKNDDIDDKRFQHGAEKYALYLDTPEGRLRSDLAFANIKDFLSPENAKSALDLGCGTGALAVRLAALGLHVTLLDSSQEMLDIASWAARDAGVFAKVTLTHADVCQLADYDLGSFDLIVCHNVLEFVDAPEAVLRVAASGLRNSSAMLSVLVRNQAGEVLKSAIKAGDLESAEKNLSAEWGCESLYGGNVRLFRPDRIHGMLSAASLTLIAERGIRAVTDYLPASLSRTAQYERIFALERKLGQRAEFAAIARYTHYLARRQHNEDRQ